MLSIIYEGNNQTIDLVNTPNLLMTGFSGLDQPTSETIGNSNPNIKGTRYQRSQIQDRSISFTFAVYDVENTRNKLMEVFKSGERGTLTLKSDFKEGKIDCYFEDMPFNKFENPVTCTIFLRAPYPYFEGMEAIIEELTNVINMFVLEDYITEEGIVLGEILENHELTVNNESDTEVGVKIEISTSSIVTNPIIFNETTNEFIGVRRLFGATEKLVIITGVGKKKVYIEENGVQTNIVNRLISGSSFFNLKRGENKLKCEADQGGADMIVYVTYHNEYEAI